MALSKAWVESGAGAGAVEVEQIRIFEWMGYQNLMAAPYSELRASLQRLKWTSIAVGEAGGRPVPFKLLEGFTEETEEGRGAPKLLKARLDPIWCDALRSVHDWQAVDLQAYAKLAREHRRMGLARVIYLYLVSHRNTSDEFAVPLYSLRDRYAQRRFLGDDHVAGRSVLRRSDPMDDEELLKRSLKTLHDSGVCELAPVAASRLSDATLRGRFVRPNEPMMLVTQQRFISPGLWDGTARLVEAPAQAPQVAPVLLAPAAVPVQPLDQAARPDFTPEQESIILLNRKKFRIDRASFTAARGDWTPRQILHLMAEILYLRNQGSVKNASGLLLSRLRSCSPVLYNSRPEAAWSELREDFPNLPIFRKPAP
jgi:hypothetical protein